MINSKSWNADEDDKETWDTLFPYRTNDVEDYINSEGSDEDMPIIVSSTQTKVIAEGMGTLETSEALVEDIPFPVAPTEMSGPAVEAVVIDHVATDEPIYILKLLMAR